MSLKDKVDVYNRILAGLSKGVRLVAILEERGNPAARDVRRANEQLAKAAAEVRRAISKEWSARTTKVIADLRDANEKLQGQIEQIAKTIEIAGKVVNAIGYIDNIAAIAARVAGAAA